jgi:hypothetical protein
MRWKKPDTTRRRRSASRLKHELVQLGAKIDWVSIDRKRPSGSTVLMA